MRWRYEGRNHKVKAGKMQRLDMEKWKGNRASLLAFAQRHPGALTAHFVQGCRNKPLGAVEVVKETKQLREVDMQSWVDRHAGFTETRDLREATTLAYIFDMVSKKEVSMALDALVMRLLAMQRAKRKGGKWETASKVELIPEATNELGPAGLENIL